MISAENPLLGSTVLYLSKTIEEKLIIVFVTDLLASEPLSAMRISIKIIETMKWKSMKCASSMLIELNVSRIYE